MSTGSKLRNKAARACDVPKEDAKTGAYPQKPKKKGIGQMNTAHVLEARAAKKERLKFLLEVKN